MTQSIVERWRERIRYDMEGPKGFAYVLEHRPVEPEKSVKPGGWPTLSWPCASRSGSPILIIR